MSQITIETAARRIYLVGNTYPVRDQIRAAGGHWDADRKAWWLGVAKRAEAAAIAAAAPAATQERKTDGMRTVVAARGEYRGTGCYAVGRVSSSGYGMSSVATVVSRDATKILLCSRDGERQWWAECGQFTTLTEYSRPSTIQSLRDFAAAAKDGLSQSDYRDAIQMAEDMDDFAASRQMESMGYAQWRAQQTQVGGGR